MNHVEPVYWTSPNNKQFALETYGRDLFLPDGQFNDGSEAARKWAARATANLKAWGFNTFGMHNPLLESLHSTGDAYYVTELGLRVPWGWNMKRSELIKAFGRNPLDVFGDAFAAQVQTNAEREVKPRASDPRVLGYAYSDGPPWSVDDDMKHGDDSLHPWVLALMSLPTNAKGKQTWLAMMKERHPSPVAAGAVCMGKPLRLGQRSPPSRTGIPLFPAPKLPLTARHSWKKSCANGMSFAETPSVSTTNTISSWVTN